MVQRPENYLDRVLRLNGLRYFNFHYEATDAPAMLLQRVRQAGLRTAITISPDTPVAALRPLLANVDMVLLMSVYPGFGGQKFIPATLDRIRELRAMAAEMGRDMDIQVDGGVNHDTAIALAQAGATILVAGSYVFGADDPAARVDELKSL